MHGWRFVSSWCAALLCLCGAISMGAPRIEAAESLSDPTYGLCISEFLAGNKTTLADGDGRFSDWIEIYNGASVPADLSGWRLTDNAKKLEKWTFPAGTEIPARGRLVVFASGRDDASYLDAAGYLHTNFRLAKDGGYLALVAPDGQTVIHAYASYPAQEDDVSYGLTEPVVTLVDESAQAAYQVPAAADQDEAWTDPNYDDSAWQRGPTGLGFGVPGATTEGLAAYWPLDEGAGSAARDIVHAYNGSLTGSPQPAWTAGPAGYDAALQFNGQAGSYVDFGRVGLNLGARFTLACWVNAPTAALGRFGVMLAKGPKDAGHFELYLNGVTGGGRTNGGAALYAPDLGDFWADYVVADGAWRHLAWTYDGGNIRFYANGALRQTFAASGQVTSETERLAFGALTDGGFPFLGALDEVRIYDRPLTEAQVEGLAGAPADDIKTDVRGIMQNISRTLRMRLAFTCSDPTVYDTLLLRIKAVDGFAAYLNGVPVCQGNVPEGLGEFDLSADAALLRPGRNVLALQGGNDSAADPSFLLLATLTAAGDAATADAPGYFPSPTPGERNGTGYPALAEAPQFTRDSGTFSGSFSLALSTASPAARLFYTTDGSEPTPSAPAYTTPILIDRSGEVRARAYEPNRAPSATVSRFYLAVRPDLAAFRSNLPVVLIDTCGRDIPGTDGTDYAEARAVFAEGDAVSYAGRIGLRIRGRSSTQFPKKQYKLETWNDADADREVPLLGLPAESDWVLAAPYTDKTLMRNYLAYRWWERLGHYSVRTRFCEVFLNDDGDAALSYADDYVGVYVLTESVKIGADRVDLAAGECIVEMGNIDPGGFASTISGQTVAFAYSDPDADRLPPAQRQWVRDCIADFETALYGPNAAYAAYTDVDSQIDYDLMREFTRNFDGGSTFFSIDRSGRLTMGPLWDYEMALGNVNYAHNDEPGYFTSGWNDSYMAPGVNGWSPWWYRFREDPAYRQQRSARWFELRKGPLSDADIRADIAAASTLLGAEATARNFVRWPILGQYVWANPPGWDSRKTYQNEIDWMTQWLLARAAWIDAQFVQP